MGCYIYFPLMSKGFCQKVLLPTSNIFQYTFSNIPSKKQQRSLVTGVKRAEIAQRVLIIYNQPFPVFFQVSE